MKLLYCQDCGDVVRPARTMNRPRKCFCGRHTVWHMDDELKWIVAHDANPDKDARGRPREPRAWVLHVHNALTDAPDDWPLAKIIDDIGGRRDTAPWFSQDRSVIARSRPGRMGQTAWSSEVPIWPPEGTGNIGYLPATI